MYDRIRITFDRNSDQKLLAMFDRSHKTLSRKKGWKAPAIIQRDK